MAATWAVAIDWPGVAGAPPVTPPTTPKTAELTDTFRTVDTAKWLSTANVSAVGSRARMSIPASGTALFSTGANHYDLTNSYLGVQLAVLPSAATSSTYLRARVSASPESHLLIGMESGNLLMREVVSGVVSDTTLTYDPVAHRWVRLEVTGANTVLYRTSTNGRDWVTRRTRVTALTLSSIEVAIESLWWTTPAGASNRAEIAWLNMVPTEALTYTLPPFHFGTLRTINDSFSDKADDEYAGGNRVGMYEIFWDRAEPTTNGTFSSSYATQVANETATIRATGLKLTLGLGLAAPPSWTNTISNYRYVNESAVNSTDLNYVFNQLVRDEAEDYFDWIHATVGFGNVWSVRITAHNGGELMYPNSGLWGYDLNAKGTAANRPVTVGPSPYPTWTPGTGTVAQAAEWMEWYLESLADCASWQMRYLRQQFGYSGWFEILTPGSGTRPSVLATETAARFSGYSSTTGLGAVWHKLYQKLAVKAGVVVYCSSMADNSGSNDVPTAGDTATDIQSSGADGWSAYRWLVRLANEFAMPNAGENPGRGGVTDTYYQDNTSTGLMAKTLAQSQGGKALATYWAHSDQLWGLSTQTFANWAAKTAAINTTGAGVPPNPP